MTCTLHVTWDERLTDYLFRPGHPLAPVRVELTARLAREFGLWSPPGPASKSMGLGGAGFPRRLPSEL